MKAKFKNYYFLSNCCIIKINRVKFLNESCIITVYKKMRMQQHEFLCHCIRKEKCANLLLTGKVDGRRQEMVKNDKCKECCELYKD